MRAVSSPRGAVRKKAKPPSGQELTHEIGSLFSSPDREVAPIPMSNDRQVTKAIGQVLYACSRSEDWDGRVEAVKQTVAIVKGGAANFISFVRQVDKLIPILSDCVLNLRSTLVKYGCLLITELCRKLQGQFAIPVLPLIPKLFRPTASGTQIIADSCKLAILAIARHCPSRKVLQAIVDVHASKSSVHRAIVSNAVVLVVTHWDVTFLAESFGVLERVVLLLLSDPSPEARQLARDAFRRLSDSFPDKSQRLFGQLDVRQKSSFGEVRAPARRSASVESRRREHVLPRNQFAGAVSGREAEYVNYVRQLVLQGEAQHIRDAQAEIARNLVAAMSGATPAVLASALVLLDDVLRFVPGAFAAHLEPLLRILLRDSARTRDVAERVLGHLAAKFPQQQLIASALASPDSVALIRFVGAALAGNRKLLNRGNCRRVIGLCLSVCVCADADPDPDAVGTALEIFAIVRADFAQVLRDVRAASEGKVAAFLAGFEGDSFERLIERLGIEADKGPIVRALANTLEAEKGSGFEDVLPLFVRLSRGRFADEIEAAMQTIGMLIDSARIIDAAVPMLASETEDPAAFVEFLTRVITRAAKGVLVPRIPRIMSLVVPLMSHESAETRKSSVLCIVEMRIVVGREFDAEISRLKNVPRRLVLHYLARRCEEDDA
jgi:hypothetical protein